MFVSVLFNLVNNAFSLVESSLEHAENMTVTTNNKSRLRPIIAVEKLKPN
jgi:hypothetical protein